ncbi:MAG TPA: ABC transporter substrate-binding protein [Nocardioidaceae bacterium]|nr:ABC transporter substrate-binding protein [Nocardioidaceae bacterium]
MFVRRGALAIVLTLVVAFTVGCAAEGTGGTGGDEGTVTVAHASFNKEKLYPPLHDSNGLVYYGPMFDFLIGADSDGKLSTETGALESYTPNEDATAWTLTLRSGMKWHDGTDVTSADLDFTLKEYADPEALCGQVCGSLLNNLASVDIVDDLTVQMNLKNPDVNVPALLGPIEGNALLLPKAHVETVGRDGFESDPMGSGPWTFDSRQVGQSITYKANGDYWNADREPKFETLNIVLAPDQNTRMAMLKSNEADLVAITPDQVPSVKSDGFEIFTIDDTVFSQVYFFESYDAQKITNKLEFRKALALAIDMDEVIRAFYPEEVGRRSPGDSTPFSPETLGHDDSLTPYEYDPEEAKRLLSEAGYDGSKVILQTMTFPDTPEAGDVNEAIAGFWEKVGVNVEIVPGDFAQLSEKILDGSLTDGKEVVVTGFPTSNRPSVLTNIQTNMLSPEAGGRLRAYWDPAKMDAYYNELRTIVDENERSARLQEINQELKEEYWTIPIALKNTTYAAGERIQGWTPIQGISKLVAYESLEPSE